MKKKQGHQSFADLAVSRRKLNTRFFDQVDAVLDWKSIERKLNRYYRKGKRLDGNLAYSGLLLFKMSLLGIWYGLSDRQVEDRVNDSLASMRFCGLSLDESVPDHSILSRFRTEVTQNGGWDVLLMEINLQLNRHGLLVRSGILVDASITESPRRPKGKKSLEVQSDNENEADTPLNELRVVAVPKPGQDLDAKWTRKAGKIHYGYKKHHATDLNGLVLAVETTAANMHDCHAFPNLIERSGAEKGARVYADKGYCGKTRNNFLKEKGLKNGIQQRVGPGKKLSKRQKERNKLISKVRYAVERTFGSQVRWFGAGTARYTGLGRVHSQHVLEAIAYNLKRMPRLMTMKLLENEVHGRSMSSL